jgi:chromosome segregation ATPase
MKTILNKTLMVAVGSIMLASLASPAFAVENGGSSGNRGQVVCARIDVYESISQKSIGAHIDSMNASFASQLSRIVSAESTIDQRISASRDAYRTQFESRIQTMLDQPGLTAQQITAISTYRTDVLSANEAREQAIDEARATYRTAAESAVSERQQAVGVATAEYQTSVDQAFKKAKSNCSTSDDSMSTMRSEISSARSGLAKARDTKQPREALSGLAETRRSAIQTANQNFTQKVSELNAELKTYLFFQ